MKTKIAITVITLAVALLGVMFNAIPVKANPDYIKIGIIGPVGLPHMYPGGMWDGASLAAKEINDAGGVKVGETYENITLDMGNEHAIDLDINAAKSEAERLIVTQGDQFLIGGFRTEVTGPIIETAMDYNTPFFICGASTNELIQNGTGRYAGLFRVTPLNSSMLAGTMFAFIGGWLVPTELLPVYGDYLWEGATKKQVRIAVVTEQLAWTNTIHFVMTNPAVYPNYFGPNVNVTYSAQTYQPANYNTITTGIKNSGARLVVIVFSGTDGGPLVEAIRTAGIDALIVGINVLGQLQDHWEDTGAACDYECTLAFAGTRTPIVGNNTNGKTVKFWDDFLAYTEDEYGTAAWPIYTAWGAYDAVYGLKEAIETAGTTNLATLLPILAATDRLSLAGRFRYSKTHDVFASPADVMGAYATGNTRAMMVQWRNFTKTEGPRMDVVWPIGGNYSRMVRLTPDMYPLTITDIYDGNATSLAVEDGIVDIKDIAYCSKCFGSVVGYPPPKYPPYNMIADLYNRGKIDIKDVATVSKTYVTDLRPLPYTPP